MLRDALAERGRERIPDQRLAGLAQCVQGTTALVASDHELRGGIAAVSQVLLVDDHIDVLGEPLDQLPALGQGRPSLEGQPRSDLRETEQFPQRPAHPEVFFDADGGQMQARLDLRAGGAAPFHGQVEKPLHWSACGAPSEASSKKIFAIQAGAYEASRTSEARSFGLRLRRSLALMTSST